jgi:hypothetical protein
LDSFPFFPYVLSGFWTEEFGVILNEMIIRDIGWSVAVKCLGGFEKIIKIML